MFQSFTNFLSSVFCGCCSRIHEDTKSQNTLIIKMKNENKPTEVISVENKMCYVQGNILHLDLSTSEELQLIPVEY